MSARNYRATVSNDGGELPIDERNPGNFKALLQSEDREIWEEIK
jgi:hypothetical protein